MRPVRDLAGQRFGRLLVLTRSGSRKGMALWQCRCDCGAEAYVPGGHLTSRNGKRTQSCGCLKRERFGGDARRTHGRSKEPAFKTWIAINHRCNSPRNKGFKNYGGRGIKVGYASYEQFFDDMGNPPPGMSIERIDNDRGYEPGNCCWATQAIQSRNRRTNRKLTLHGRTMCITDWAADLGYDLGVLRWRLKMGWSVERALTEPIRLNYAVTQKQR